MEQVAPRGAWNGHAAHVTTGVARTRETHCQPSNCSAGTMASTTTGRERSTDDDEPSPQRARLVRRSRVGPDGTGVVTGRLDLGDELVDPDAGGRLDPGLLGGVVDLAVTPSRSLRCRSMRAAHEAQDMPLIASSTSLTVWSLYPTRV